MSNRQSQTTRRVAIAAILIVLLAAALLVVILVNRTDAPEVAPEPVVTASQAAPPNTTPAETPREMPEPGEKAPQAVEPAPEPAPEEVGDFLLQLNLPKTWPVDVPCIVEVVPYPEDEGGIWPRPNTREVLISRESGARVPVSIPDSGGALLIRGPKVQRMFASMKWQDDKAALQMEVGDQTDKRLNALRMDSLVFRPGSIARGSTFEVRVRPMVTVSAVTLDARGTPFWPRVEPHWELSWSLHFQPDTIPKIGSRSNFTREGVTAYWQVPAGVGFYIGGVGSGAEPAEVRREAPEDTETLAISFRFTEAALGRIRVLSQDGAPLPDAQFRFPSADGAQFSKQVDTLDAPPGTFVFLMPENPRDFVVWEPNHLPQLLRSGAVPRDGTSVDVTLQRSQPAVLVKVDFDPPIKPEDRLPITLKVTVGTFVGSDQFSWSYEVELPASGEYTVSAQQGRTPFVRPQSRYYAFEQLEKSEQAGLFLRRFVARIRSGVYVRFTDGDLSWDASKRIQMRMHRPLNVRGSSESTAEDSGYVDFSPEDRARAEGPWFINLAPGEWVLTAMQDGVTGFVETTVGATPHEVEIKPVRRYRDWVNLKIVDSTGECSEKGTVLFSGRSRIGAMQRARSSLQRMVEGLLARNEPNEPREGEITYYHCIAVCAHRSGRVLVPGWFETQVLVMPPESFAVYQGVIDFEAETVTITRATWTGSASFSPVESATDEQRTLLAEEGWVVCVVEDRADNPRDANAEFPCRNGAVSISSLPPGSYVAWYHREIVTEEVDPTTGRVTGRATSGQAFDRVKFEVRSGHTSVSLPASRE